MWASFSFLYEANVSIIYNNNKYQSEIRIPKTCNISHKTLWIIMTKIYQIKVESFFFLGSKSRNSIVLKTLKKRFKNSFYLIHASGVVDFYKFHKLTTSISWYKQYLTLNNQNINSGKCLQLWYNRLLKDTYHWFTLHLTMPRKVSISCEHHNLNPLMLDSLSNSQILLHRILLAWSQQSYRKKKKKKS